jgi:rhomboid protease GluP
MYPSSNLPSGIPGEPVPQQQRPVQPPIWKRYPPVSSAIFVICVLVFGAELLVPGLLTSPIQLGGRRVLMQDGALFGPLVGMGQWWRILGTVFTHGGPIHILFNMMVLMSLGMPLERQLGTARFIMVSLVTALGSSAMVLWFNFLQPTVGASGMILGWAGAMFPLVNQHARRSMGIWLLQIAIISFLPGVSWAGHLGGLLAGVPCGLLLRDKGGRAFWAITPVLLIVLGVVCWLAVGRGMSALYIG